MRYSLQISSLAIVLAACGANRTEKTLVKGAPHEFDAVCSDAHGDTSFRVYEGQGLLQSLHFPGISFQCSRQSADDAAKGLLWVCNDKVGSDSKIEIRVKGGVTFAKVSLAAPNTGLVDVLACF